MKRIALIITNPGKEGSEDYCSGVNVDSDSYKRYLKSPLGGLYDDDEIYKMNKPSTNSLINFLRNLENIGYLFIIFSGHGWYSTKDRQTILQLNDHEDLAESDMIRQNTKQTIILDCCREPHSTSVKKYDKLHEMAKKEHYYNKQKCREMYDQGIKQSTGKLLVLYACSKNETSGDDATLGGLYSSSLINTAYDWADTIVKSNDYPQTLSIVKAHITAAKETTKTRFEQNPSIQKARTGPYFPFAVVA